MADDNKYIDNKRNNKCNNANNATDIISDNANNANDNNATNDNPRGSHFSCVVDNVRGQIGGHLPDSLTPLIASRACLKHLSGQCFLCGCG